MAKLEWIGTRPSDLSAKLKLADKKAPHKIYNKMDEMGKRIIQDVKKVTPEDKRKIIGGKRKPPRKRLKNRWRQSGTSRSFGGDYTNYIMSTAPHFHLVERGHKVVPRRARFTGTKRQYRVKLRQGKRFVEGQFFFAFAMGQVENRIWNDFDNLLDEILEDI